MEDDADRHYTIISNQKSGLHAGADFQLEKSGFPLRRPSEESYGLHMPYWKSYWVHA